MAYDIYGNGLRPGYCEVHPDVPEQWPCGYCRDADDRAEMDRAQEEAHQQERDAERMAAEAGCPWGCLTGADVGAPDWAAAYIANAQPDCPHHGTPCTRTE